jgi:hypothetical protein
MGKMGKLAVIVKEVNCYGQEMAEVLPVQRTRPSSGGNFRLHCYSMACEAGSGPY